jgi:ribonucleoside-diphosphate reductase alpha chain
MTDPTLTTKMGSFARDIWAFKYAREDEPTWADTARRVVTTVMEPYFPELVEEMVSFVAARKFMPGGRYLYATGRPFNQTQNCLLLRAGDSREEWGDLMRRVTTGSMTGAGIGVVYSDLREKGALVKGMGGTSTGPLALMQMVNEAGRYIMQGGSRRVALWAGLHWDHPDVFDFITIKDWSDDVVAAKAKDFTAPAPMDNTNISVILDTRFFQVIEDPEHPDHDHAQRVYWMVVEKMLTTAEPGFSIDAWENEGENLRNACTEVTSADDNDICNLGSINLARVESIEEMARVTEVGTAFLTAGTLYSKVPYQEVADTREKNRRLGLGVMGFAEWLVVRGYRYEGNPELAAWLDEYAKSGEYANAFADRLGISRPVKTRAIAPTGTIGILAETTTGIEPLFALAYKRRYFKNGVWFAQYVIDATAQRLIDKGVKPEDIETAYELAKDPERRIRFQAWVQGYVDHGISSTLNLPAVAEQPFSTEDFGTMLLRYLPSLRGVTCYPDGARGGQPLNVVPYAEAVGWEGVEFEEVGSENACVSGVCGV